MNKGLIQNLSANKLSSLVVVACYLYFAGFIAYILYSPMTKLIPLVADDSFYFIKIARNFVQGYGLTFDQINQTNGFQPLWFIMLIPLAYIGQSLSTEMFFRAVLVYQCLILLLSSTIINLTFWRQWSLPTIALVNTLIVISAPYLLQGMESPAVLLVASLMLFWLSRRAMLSDFNNTDWLVLGLWMGALALARLDNIFILLVVAIFLLVAKNRFSIDYIKRVVWFGLGVSVLLLPYILFNKYNFGDFMPISGKLKNSFPFLTNMDFSTQRIRWSAYAALLLGFIYVRLYIQHFRSISLVFVWVCWWLGSWLHLLHTGLWMKWAVFSWHFISSRIFFVLAMPAVFERIQYRSIMFRNLGLALCIVLLAYATTRTFFRPPSDTWTLAAYQAALWVREQTASDDIFAMKDAGTFGYFSERKVINLDGLVNNKKLQEYIANKK